MAIDGNAHSPTNVRVAIAEESVFGTAITAQSSFRELHITDVPGYDAMSGYIVDETMRHDGQHMRGDADYYKTQAGATETLQVSFIATFQDLAELLPSLFQNADTSGDVTTYTWDHSTDKQAGTGLNLLTVHVHDPEKPYYMKCAVLKTLETNWGPGSDGDRIRCTATFISGFPVVRSGVTSTPADWTAPSTNWFTFGSLGTMTVNSEDYVCTGGSLTIDNGAVRIGNGADGVCEGYVVGVTGKKGYVASGSISALYDGVTEGWLDLAESTSTIFPINLIWGASSLSNELRINMYAQAQNAQPDAGGDMGMETTLTFHCTADGTNEGVEMVLDTNVGT